MDSAGTCGLLRDPTELHVNFYHVIFIYYTNLFARSNFKPMLLGRKVNDKSVWDRQDTTETPPFAIPGNREGLRTPSTRCGVLGMLVLPLNMDDVKLGQK